MQRYKLEVNGAKDVDVFLLTFYCIFETVQLLHEAPYFGTFLPNPVATKSIKIIRAKACSIATKTVGESDPWATWTINQE